MNEPPIRSDTADNPLPTSSTPPDQEGAPPLFLGPRGNLGAGIRAACFLIPAYYLTRLTEAVIFGVLGPRVSLFTALTISRGFLSIVLLLLSAMFLAAFDRRSFRTLGLWFYQGWAEESLWGAAIGAFLMALAVGLIVAGRGIVYMGLAHGADFGRSSALVFLMFLVAGAMEEILFRGYGFQRLVESLGAVSAVALMSAFFGLVHIANPSATILSTLNTVLAGVLFSTAYLRTRALWLPMAMHWAWNFFQGQIFSLPVSGLRMPQPLFDLRIPGPSWLTGGAYGPEGGLVVTAVALAGILWIARTRHLATSPAMQEVLQ